MHVILLDLSRVEPLQYFGELLNGPDDGQLFEDLLLVGFGVGNHVGYYLNYLVHHLDIFATLLQYFVQNLH